MKTRLCALVVVALSFGPLASGLHAQSPCGSLPPYPVDASYVIAASETFFQVTLSNVGTGFDVTDGTYPGWCAEDNHRANTTPATLLCSLDSGLPGNLSAVPWGGVNYLLNNKQGGMCDVQAALWLLIWGTSESCPVTQAALDMLGDALANGPGFVPGPGELVAVILYTGDGGIGSAGFQDTFIEIPVTQVPIEPEGCTPGFWKNHPDEWLKYHPAQYFDDVFAVGPHTTLWQSLRLRGGDVRALMRHATAALLNATHPEVAYAFSEARVIAMVQQAFATGAFEATKDLFEAQNDYPSVCLLH